ncbi:hypothetical protein [Orlajensenia leifsoniae]|uniref:Uncharacterized protein n=1 Tax=Orlajensenia leifsoniae TaxID=2561933 RepID=A0A4Y9QTH9_9MICO|nr:hypothetical protein [Leifsonia flava]TFV95390.1 hypothetical protein E4M00_15200 [Leifsonia flava]
MSTPGEKLKARFARRFDATSIDGDLLVHVAEQLSFIDTSCAAYDLGNRAEAKRLATTVRVLAHDSEVATSLLSRMSMRDEMPWADGSIPGQIAPIRERQSAGHRQAASVLTIAHASLGLNEDMKLIGWAPAFEEFPVGQHHVPFKYWWESSRMWDVHGTEVSRRLIVHWLANKDGGAHVDVLPAEYEAIARLGSMGLPWSDAAGGLKREHSPIRAAMRQIAEEVRVSVREALALT